MSWTSLDAWGQRENETPPVDKEETKEIKIELTFEYSSYDEHPSEWNCKRLLGVDWVDVEDWVDND